MKRIDVALAVAVLSGVLAGGGRVACAYNVPEYGTITIAAPQLNPDLSPDALKWLPNTGGGFNITNNAVLLDRPTAFSFDPYNAQVDEYYERIRTYCQWGYNPRQNGVGYYDGTQGIYSSTQTSNDNAVAWGIFDCRDPNNPVNYDKAGETPTQGRLVGGEYASSILVRATYLGDANCDGQVDYKDFQAYWYGRLHPERIGVAGDPNHPSGKWQFGDFNFDGVVDGSTDLESLWYGYLFQWDALLPGLMHAEPNVHQLLTWRGSVSGTWDVNTTTNFSEGGSGKFNDGDYITFDDSGSHAAITVAAGGVAPGNVVFLNTTYKDYSLSGGPITGGTGLVVDGGGRLTLSNANTYTGGTIVAGGTLVAAHAQSLPASGSVTVSAGPFLGQVSSLVLSQKGTSWPHNSGAVYDIGLLTMSGGTVDVTNNLIRVNYAPQRSPYADLAQAVNTGAITQSTGLPNRTVGIYDNGSSVLVGYACPGDSMLRGKVDSRDIGRVLAAGKYGIGPSNARWDEGDFTHDGQVNSRDIGAILGAGVYGTGTYDSGSKLVISGPPSAGRATLIYDATTGDVKIDPNGNTMTGFDLWDSAGNFFIAGANMPPGGAFVTNDATEKFWSSFNPPNYLVALWDLGNIAPAGLTEAQFKAALNNAPGDTVWYKAGGGAFDYNVSYVPEPSSLAMAAAGALAFLAVGWRWRRTAQWTVLRLRQKEATRT
jgi:autotransporter-associated beta strand protein